MKKILLLTAYLLLVALAGFSNPLDSLKQQLQITTDDTQKASIYLQLANCYMQPANAANAYTKRINQENAINYTMLAMKVYYRKDDTTGLVNSYSNLSKAYRAQKKYAQAKWFILQANTLSRRQNATPSIINTLVDLAAIKMDIKDYKLPKGVTMDYDDGTEKMMKKAKKAGVNKGTIDIRYLKYEVNKGLSDAIFVKKAK